MRTTTFALSLVDRSLKLRIKQVGDIDLVNDFPDAKGFLFDAHVPGLYGGTGQRIDPELIPHLPEGSILAGGLNPENVADAIAVMQPFAVDVSSGVEVQTGVKDPELLARFFQAVETADRR